MARPFIIAVEGLIGAGKTTLLKTLEAQNCLPNAVIIHEPLQKLENHASNPQVHPLLELYKDPQRNACIFQNYVLEVYDERIASMINQYGNYQTIILDRSLDSCNVFTNTNIDLFSSFGHFYLTDKYLKIRRKYFGNSPISANAVFYLDVPPEVAMYRVKKRNREGEESIPIKYIQKLQSEYEEYLEFASKHVAICKANVQEDMVSQFMTFVNSLNIPEHKSVPTYKTEVQKWVC